MNKKTLAGLMALIITVCIAGCSAEQKSGNETAEKTEETTAVSETTEESVTEAPESETTVPETTVTTSEETTTPDITEIDFNVLVNRYKELVEHPGTTETVPYEIDATIIEIDTAKIDNDYMNSKFRKYLKQLSIGDVEATQAALDELYSSFASLHQDEQKYANVLIHDIQNGDIVIEEGKSIREYITEYQITAKNGQIHRLSEVFGLDEQLLNNMMNSLVTESNINEYGRLDNLKDTVDVDKAKAYFEQKEQRNIPKRMIPAKVDELLRNFIINGGFDI